MKELVSTDRRVEHVGPVNVFVSRLCDWRVLPFDADQTIWRSSFGPNGALTLIPVKLDWFGRIAGLLCLLEWC